MSVSNKAIKASKHQIVYLLLGKVLAFVFGILIARILIPEDYGVLTIALVFSSLFTIFSNFGFQTYILQNTSAKASSIHSVFFLVASFSLLIGTGLYCSSDLINQFYRVEALGQILKIYALVIFLNGICSVPLSDLKRRLDFKSTGRADLLYLITSNISRFILAKAGYAALCFPLGDLIGLIFKLLYSFYVTRFIPSISKIEKSEMKEILSFGSFTSLTSLGSYFANQIDKFLISKKFSLSSVGQYNFGYQQASVFYNLVQVSQTSLLISYFAKYKENPLEAKRVYLKIHNLLLFAALPFYSFCLIEAESILVTVFSPKWLPALIFFKIFLADFLIRSFIAGITGIQISFGLAKKAAKTKIINSLLFIACLCFATFFNDIKFYAYFYLLASSLCAFHNFMANGRLINLSVMEIFKHSIVTIIITIFTILCYYAIDLVWGDFSENWALLILHTTVFTSIYISITLMINKSQFSLILDFIKRTK